MWGIDSSAEEFNLGLYMKLKLQLSSLLPPGVHTPGINLTTLSSQEEGGGEFDIRELKQQWQQQKHHLKREVTRLQTAPLTSQISGPCCDSDIELDIC